MKVLGIFIPALLAGIAAAAPLHVVVAQDGSGDFKTIQMAIDHAPAATPSQRLVIEIRPGVYKERLVLPQDRARTTFLGSDAANTVITSAMSAKGRRRHFSQQHSGHRRRRFRSRQHHVRKHFRRGLAGGGDYHPFR